MDFFSLFVVASAPVLEILLLGLLGVFLASGYCNILSVDARKYINKIVFVVFAPALIFGSLAETVTLQDIISWWFMPVNIAITFFIGGILGWVAAKILKPERHLEGIIIASCSAGNLGNLPLIVIPAICNEDGNPFGESKICNSRGLSYASSSMAQLGGIFIWIHAYSLVRKPALLYGEIRNGDERSEENTTAHREREEGCNDQEALFLPSAKPVEDLEHQIVVPFFSKRILSSNASHFWESLKGVLKVAVHRIAEELLTPATIAARWNNTLCYSYPRRQSNSRTQQVSDKAFSDFSNHRRALCNPSALWHCCSKVSNSTWLPSTISTISFCSTDTIHSTSSHEYRYNGSII